MKQASDRPHCFRCRHFFITWERRRGYGCRAMGFKANIVPHLVVLRESGSPCLMFSPKPPRPSSDGDGRE